MKFTFEESELINAFAEDISVVLEKDAFIERLLNSKSDNEDPELTMIADSAITKLQIIDEHTFIKMISNLPVDTFTLY